ncbi:ATP-binding response regulator [Cognatilysobacter tabacisoli]|uniref:ATP-binding response regulator n=1 Tax=Cognatilysobacter tabacisoli TaxID=2315424 RepID=UPI000E6AF131|nr:ATP-binding protein [Lysobacter tabacisoli]
MPDRRIAWLHYLAAPAAVALALFVRVRFWPELFEVATFLPLFMAVLFCAWLGGLGPGLVATVLGAVASAWWLLPPTGSFAIAGGEQQLQLALFVLLALAITLACESLHDERRRAEGLRHDIDDLEAMQARLHALAADLSEADRRKDEFLATLAHELRNPLAPISNSLEILRLAPDPDTLQAARATMARQLAHLVRLVDDLLDVSRISRDKLQLRREIVALQTVVDNVVESAGPFVASQGHALAVSMPDEPIELEADPVRLAQVVGNLLHNAAKYTPHGGHLSIEATLDDDTVEIVIADDGIGLPDDLRDRVFDMFRQGDASLERTRGGLGIGLGLARRLVELHGGTILLDSDGPGRGTRAVVRLPALRGARGGEGATAAEPVATPAVRPLRIVVADDNRDAADTMAQVLRAAGHHVNVANDGIEALALAESVRPDLLLLDIGMPGLNGFEVCRRLRTAPWARSVPIVAITGLGQPSDRDRSRDAGFDAHWIKPIDPARLHALIAGLDRANDAVPPTASI